MSPIENIVVPEHPTSPTDPRLGRLLSIDPRDRRHLLPRPVELPPIRRKVWPIGPILDQGSTSMCVEYGGQQFLMSGPVFNQRYKKPGELYRQCRLVDEWPGENYDGTSVRALFIILKGAGYIDSYKWAFDLETTLNHLLTIGPVVVGTNWYESMYRTDRDGFCRIISGSRNVGGHCYVLYGTDRDTYCPDKTKGEVLMVNSWGYGWGKRGVARMSFKDLTRLIREWGEVASAFEKKFVN